MFLRIAFGLFEAFWAEYVDLTFPSLNSRQKKKDLKMTIVLLFVN